MAGPLIIIPVSESNIFLAVILIDYEIWDCLSDVVPHLLYLIKGKIIIGENP